MYIDTLGRFKTVLKMQKSDFKKKKKKVSLEEHLRGPKYKESHEVSLRKTVLLQSLTTKS